MNTLKNATILALDDEPINLLLLNNFLEQRCKHLLLESDIESAIALAVTKQPNLILLDIVMAEMDGYEVCTRLKATIETTHIPVIFLSSLLKPADKVKGFQVGGNDFITKPFDVEEVMARIENCLRLHQQIQQKRKMTTQQREEKIAFYQLSEREVEILRLYALGMQRNEIAQKLCIGDSTVKTHLQRLFIKLAIQNRVQAVEKAREIGLLDF